MSSLIDSAVSGVESIGKIYSDMGVIIGAIISIVLLVIAYKQIKEKYPYTSKTKGTIEKANCSQVVNHDTKDVEENCQLQVNYMAPVPNSGGMFKNYSATITTDSQDAYNAGQVIEVAYNPTNPSDAKAFTYFTPKVIGWLLVVMAIFVFGGSLLTAYLANKSNAFAFLFGAQQAEKLL